MNPIPKSTAETLTKGGAVLLLSYGCWRVLEPFATAILFSLAIAVSTWRPYAWLMAVLPGRRSLAASIACLAVALLVIAPMAMLILSLGDAARWIFALINEWRASGPIALPDWLSGIPVAGQMLKDWLQDLTSGSDHLSNALSALAEPAQRAALAGGRALGWGMGQAFFAGLLLFFVYRDGGRAGVRLDQWVVQLGGERARLLLDVAHSTVEGVMLGVMGAGLAQAILATLGFVIAGVPNPVLLGALTFVSSIIPVGPPLIWGGAALHLFQQGHPGWAGFMVVYGFLGISSIDNLVKPLLISRSSRLPFIVTFTGVLGGVLAFGVAGLFIGPIVLALALNIAAQPSLPPKDDRPEG